MILLTIGRLLYCINVISDMNIFRHSLIVCLWIWSCMHASSILIGTISLLRFKQLWKITSENQRVIVNLDYIGKLVTGCALDKIYVGKGTHVGSKNDHEQPPWLTADQIAVIRNNWQTLKIHIANVITFVG